MAFGGSGYFTGNMECHFGGMCRLLLAFLLYSFDVIMHILLLIGVICKCAHCLGHHHCVIFFSFPIKTVLVNFEMFCSRVDFCFLWL